MRYITIPADITITDGTNSAAFSFVTNLVMNTLTLDPQFGASVAALHASRDIRESFKEAKPGDVIALSDDLYSQLRTVTDRPTHAYAPAIMLQVLSHLDAILKAPDTKPAA